MMLFYVSITCGISNSICFGEKMFFLFFFYIVVKMYLYDLKKVELEIDGVIFLL